MPNEEEGSVGATVASSRAEQELAPLLAADDAHSSLTVPEVLEALRSFSERIAETIVAGRREGVLRPTEEVYIRHPLENGAIKTTDFGVELVSFLTEEFVKESWFHATRTVVWRLQASDEYSAILKMLKQTKIGPERANQLLDSFAHRVSYSFLETDDVDARRNFLSSQLETVRKHLNEERFRHTSEVRLVGLVATPTPIELAASGTDVFLRRVVKEDLVEECSEFMDRHRDIWRPRPTAILRLSKVVERENEVQKGVWQAITILRLFKVGSVRELSYTNETDSFFAMGGTFGSHQHYSAVTRSVIEEADTDRFKAFWQKLIEVLPTEGYGRDQKRVDPIEIAYKRYSDALLSWGGTVERRISDAVIGLESLLLSENDELSYRLRLRAAKLLCFAGQDPYLVQNVIRQAYSVRSAFLHGDEVKKETRKQIERDYESLDNLLLRVLEQLRCCIVMVTLRKMTKSELINRLDNAFIDNKAAQQLEEMFTEAGSIA